jgi:alkanesulfonate monooxygenase SsuD/methylene tetrahydromethanopterin reductase-like flavin-dependent oxidoreductase (luciferase family)
MSDEEFRAATSRHFVGTPDDVAADLQRRVLDPGVDGIIVNLVPNGHEPGVVTMVGEMLGKLLP